MKYKHYGDAGVLILPWQNYSIPLYHKRKGHVKEIIDEEDSAVYDEFFYKHCHDIGDHASQGFRIIKECGYTCPAIIQTPGKTRIYRWVASMEGRNTGSHQITATGQRQEDVTWAELCLSTCNGADGKSLFMVFFKFQEEVDYEMYEVEDTQKPNASSDEIKYVQATTTVNFRRGPSTSYSIIDTLSKGTKVIYLGETSNGEWFNIEYKNKVGWISSKYSRLTN